MRAFLKTATRKYMPNAYPILRSVAIGAIREGRMIRGMGIKGIYGSIMRVTEPWYKELPVQEARRVTVPFEIRASSSKDTGELLAEAGIAHSSGRHAVYLSPSQWRDTVFQEPMGLYPEGTGLKLMRHAGGVETDYVGKPSSSVYKVASHDHRHLMIVAHYLFAQGVGPEPRDLLEFQLGSRKLVGYAIEHIPERSTIAEAQALVDRLRALVQTEALLCIAPNGLNHDDFRPPEFGDNVRKRQGGSEDSVYIDFQNFAPRGYDDYLERVATDAVEATHFGDKCLLRGGRHLYQRIPGVALPAKRDLRKRMQTVDSLLLQAGQRISDRVVIDVGCNLGMAIAEYLRRGARWCYGWDLPTTIPHSKKVLGAIGCTRFSLYSKDLNEPGDLGSGLENVEPGCVLSYLAIRKHIGWHPAVSTLPWTTMVYEGHEGEDEEQSLAYLRELGQRVEIESIHHAMLEEKGLRDRCVAVVKRRL